MAADHGGRTVLDRLRERVTSGLFLGEWKPGDRLPSIRDVADLEGVDRKTAASAYRRLQDEGIVQVRSRSGVFVALAAPPSAGGLEQLHRQWLANTYRGATALGLDTRVILRLVRAVAELEQIPVPIVESSRALGDAIAADLRDRLKVQTRVLAPEDLRTGAASPGEAPVVVTTPFHRLVIASLVPQAFVVEATLPSELLRELERRAEAGLVVIAADEHLRRKIASALALSRLGRMCRVLLAEEAEAGGVSSGQAALIWPGTPAGVAERLAARGVDVVRPRAAMSDESAGRIQSALLAAAVRRARATATAGTLSAAD